MIKVFIVDDSATARLALRMALESDPELHVVGETGTGHQALRLIKLYDPDIVTMDVHLHKEDGIDVTAAIMLQCPKPILIVTGANPADPDLIYRAMEAGALDVIGKPPGPQSPEHEQQKRKLIRLVRVLSEVPVVHRFSHRKTLAATVQPRPIPEKEKTPPPATVTARPKLLPPTALRSCRVVLIGSSTGGPAAVSFLLSRLPTPFPLPIVLIQHICSGFGRSFASWLTSVTGHQTVVVDRRLSLQPGRVYLAQDDHHLVFVSENELSSRAPQEEIGPVPAYDVLLTSAARWAPCSVALVMTGMGSDGTKGLQVLREHGVVTVAQSPESCVVSSMPSSAMKAGLIDHVLDLEGISELLRSSTMTPGSVKERDRNTS